MIRPWLRFKHEHEALQLMHVHWSLAMVLAAMSGWCQKNNVPFVVTSLIRTEAENQALGSTSRTHILGRAADLSLKGWSSSDIMLFKSFWLNHDFNNYYGAISKLDLEKKLVVIHGKNENQHAHIQVRGEL